MEKTWEDFWSSGKVTDYLSYRNSASSDMKEQREQDENGTGTGAYRDGVKCHADWRLR